MSCSAPTTSSCSPRRRSWSGGAPPTLVASDATEERLSLSLVSLLCLFQSHACFCTVGRSGGNGLSDRVLACCALWWVGLGALAVGWWQERVRADVVRKEAEVGALIREFEDTKAQNSELKAELEALRRRAKQGQEEERAKVRRGKEKRRGEERRCLCLPGLQRAIQAAAIHGHHPLSNFSPTQQWTSPGLPVSEEGPPVSPGKCFPPLGCVCAGGEPGGSPGRPPRGAGAQGRPGTPRALPTVQNKKVCTRCSLCSVVWDGPGPVPQHSAEVYHATVHGAPPGAPWCCPLRSLVARSRSVSTWRRTWS